MKWTKESTEAVYRKLCANNGGKSVSVQLMPELGYSSLPEAIRTYFGRKENIDIAVGVFPPRKHWTKERVRETYQNMCIQNGNQPLAQKEHQKLGLPTEAILRFYNTKQELEEELGYKPLRQFWNRKIVFESYRQLCLENGDKPVSFTDRGKYTGLYCGLQSAILEHWGSKEGLELALGYEPLKTYRTREEVISQYKDLCLQNGNKALTYEELEELGESSLGYSISRKFKNKMELEELIGYKPLRFYNWNKETVKNVYHKLCKENGDRMLGDAELIAMGHNDLVTAFSRHYKKSELDNDLGYKIIIHWTKDMVQKMYHDLCRSFGDRIITDFELKHIGHSILCSKIKKFFGGKIKLDAKLGYVAKNMFLLSNGSVVRSSYEVSLANYLIHNNIPFDSDNRISPDGRYRYDFLVKNIDGEDVYIELWGYTGTNNENDREIAYNKKKATKTELYKVLGKNLIGINGSVFKERNHFELQVDLQHFLIHNRIKTDNFKTLSAGEIMHSKNISHWNKDIVFDTYRQLCINNGDKPMGSLRGEHGPLRRAIYTYWGSKRALEEALGYTPYTQVLTKERVLKDFHSLATKLGVDFIASHKLRELRSLDCSIYKAFDSREDFYREYKAYKSSQNLL